MAAAIRRPPVDNKPLPLTKWTGRRGARIEEAGYMLPPHDRMRQSLGAFDKYVGLVDESPLPELIKLRGLYRDRLQTSRSPANLLRLVDELFEVPVLTVATAAKRLGVTWRSARGNVDKLVATDILGEIDSPGRSRLFIARGILNTIESSAFTSETGE